MHDKDWAISSTKNFQPSTLSRKEALYAALPGKLQWFLCLLAHTTPPRDLPPATTTTHTVFPCMHMSGLHPSGLIQ
jgi:hypothetical protein